jgi:hypothetical protein
MHNMIIKNRHKKVWITHFLSPDGTGAARVEVKTESNAFLRCTRIFEIQIITKISNRTHRGVVDMEWPIKPLFPSLYCIVYVMNFILCLMNLVLIFMLPIDELCNN